MTYNTAVPTAQAANSTDKDVYSFAVFLLVSTTVLSKSVYLSNTFYTNLLNRSVFSSAVAMLSCVSLGKLVSCVYPLRMSKLVVNIP